MTGEPGAMCGSGMPGSPLRWAILAWERDEGAGPAGIVPLPLLDRNRLASPPRIHPLLPCARSAVMAIRKIATLGHPVLRQVARTLTRDELASAKVQGLIDDLIETMRDANGAGIAANQVYEP